MTTEQKAEKMVGVASNLSMGARDGGGCINGVLIHCSSIVVGRRWHHGLVWRCRDVGRITSSWMMCHTVHAQWWQMHMSQESTVLATLFTRFCWQLFAFFVFPWFVCYIVHSISKVPKGSTLTALHLPNDDRWMANKCAVDTSIPITSACRPIQSHPTLFSAFCCGHFQWFLCWLIHFLL